MCSNSNPPGHLLLCIPRPVEQAQVHVPLILWPAAFYWRHLGPSPASPTPIGSKLVLVGLQPCLAESQVKYVCLPDPITAVSQALVPIRNFMLKTVLEPRWPQEQVLQGLSIIDMGQNLSHYSKPRTETAQVAGFFYPTAQSFPSLHLPLLRPVFRLPYMLQGHYQGLSRHQPSWDRCCDGRSIVHRCHNQVWGVVRSRWGQEASAAVT